MRSLLRPEHRHAQIADVAGREHRVRLSHSSGRRWRRDSARGARLDDVADEPRREARVSSASEAPGPAAPDDDLVGLEHAHGGAVGVEELLRMPGHLVEHVVGIELARELATARARCWARCRERRSRRKSSLRRARRAPQRPPGRRAPAGRRRRSARPRRRRARARPPPRPAGGVARRGASRGRQRPQPRPGRCRSARPRGAAATRAPCRRGGT